MINFVNIRTARQAVKEYEQKYFDDILDVGENQKPQDNRQLPEYFVNTINDYILKNAHQGKRNVSFTIPTSLMDMDTLNYVCQELQFEGYQVESINTLTTSKEKGYKLKIYW